VGYRLDEIQNDITRVTPAAFEPVFDYVVVKIPRWAFEKFRDESPLLGTQMKSVGEVMAIGRTFKEALQKGIRGLETGSGPSGFGRGLDDSRIKEKLLSPDPDRIFYVKRACELGWSHEEIHRMTGIDAWFLDQIQQISDMKERIGPDIDAATLRAAKRMGFSDARIAELGGTTEGAIRARRIALDIRPVYKRVDTCAAEFVSYTPYLYSTYESECEAEPTDRKKVVILGSGPNRIGQGIEFDYCCCHGSFAFKEEGYETIMVNCNPETVSTDYDTSDRLYFEPLTFEDVMNVIEKERPEGVVIQFGGQTPLRLAVPLHEAGVRILGTSPDAIDQAEDRRRFSALLSDLGIPQPESGTATSLEEAKEVAARIGYPILVRPSYVLGGRAMAIVYDAAHLEEYAREAVRASPEHPILIDRFLEDAYEVDVDAVADGERVVIAGILEHIEEAGVHSGDSSMVLPTYKVPERHLTTIKEATRRLGLALGVRGLMNIQFALQGEMVYVLEVNPRASRTVPFISKATGVPLAKVAARVMAGRSLATQGITKDLEVDRFFVKASVFPFLKFPGSDVLLGPEMKSTGEVMGIDHPYLGDRVHQRERSRQGKRAAARARAVPDGLHDRRDTGHRGVPEPPGRAGRDGLQGQRGPAARGGPDQEPGHRPHHQHTARGGVVLRRRRDPEERDPLRRALPDHAHRRRGDRAGHPRAPRAPARGDEPAGDPPARGAGSERSGRAGSRLEAPPVRPGRPDSPATSRGTSLRSSGRGAIARRGGSLARAWAGRASGTSGGTPSARRSRSPGARPASRGGR
jgi:carbamoyl-phosphate synthase large subunit